MLQLCTLHLQLLNRARNFTLKRHDHWHCCPSACSRLQPVHVEIHSGFRRQGLFTDRTPSNCACHSERDFPPFPTDGRPSPNRLRSAERKLTMVMLHASDAYPLLLLQVKHIELALPIKQESNSFMNCFSRWIPEIFMHRTQHGEGRI